MDLAMDTQPTPLADLPAGGLDDFRITSRPQIKVMLRTLADSALPLSINGPDGAMVSATLWTVDSMHEAISFSAMTDDPHLEALVQGNEAVVVGYLDSVKLQFDAHDMVLIHGARTSALSCAMPSVIYRFQRRGSFRVRPVMRSSPVVRFRHPLYDDIELTLRVLDVSLGGCALFLPEHLPALSAGMLIPAVQFELDAETRFTTALRLHHLSSVTSEAKGMRMGCELLRLQPGDERLLQLYIDQTQKKRRLMAAR